MYAQLGNILFENLKGFTDYSRTGSAVYAEHKPLTGKPRLEPTGSALDEIAISMRLHVSFGINPERELILLKQYRDENEVLPFLNGSGKVEGTFVITDINETIEDADAEGNVFSYLVKCTLKEYVTENRLKEEQNKNIKQAVAVGKKKPVAKKKKNPPTCPQKVTAIITKMENNARAINVIMEQKGGAGSDRNRSIMVEKAQTITGLSNELATYINNVTSCVAGNVLMKDKNLLVFNTSNELKSDIFIYSSFGVSYNSRALSKYVAELKAAARAIVQKSITGKK